MKKFRRTKPYPKQPEGELVLNSNRMWPWKYNRAATEENYVTANHAPKATFESVPSPYERHDRDR